MHVRVCMLACGYDYIKYVIESRVLNMSLKVVLCLFDLMFRRDVCFGLM